MILSFKPQFEPLILSGVKIHTIRRDPHNRWKYGMKIHMATGVRTKNYECFCTEFICTRVQEIHMIRPKKEWSIPLIYIDDNAICMETKEMLAKNDGFNNLEEFCNWFSDEEFLGRIIHWTDFKY